MEKKYQKNLYYAHNHSFESPVAVLGEDFNTLADFYAYAKENKMQVCFCPLNVASKMVSNYRVLKIK